MRRKTPKALIFLILSALLILALPTKISETLRSTAMSVFSPFWLAIQGVDTDPTIEKKQQQKISHLEFENIKLKEHLSLLQNLILKENFLKNQIKLLLNDTQQDLTPDFQRHKNLLLQNLKLDLQAIPARVILHSHAAWNNTLWIDVGTANNPTSDKPVISINSPVVADNSIVGVVEYVGKHQSRVRLISDPELTPSVRATRGEVQKKFLVEAIEQLLARIAIVPGLLTDSKERKQLMQFLGRAKKSIQEMKTEGSYYLAKGELHGSVGTKWRSHEYRLQGIGFNYDFGDDEGPPRDLRTGIAIDKKQSGQAIPLLQVNDLLITTGLDGVFPAGFFVGQVTKIYPLKEGDYFYELEAKPTCGNLEALSLLFVLPPINRNLD